ncbi:MAG: class I SAM-dependent methyltransferase [Rhodospirillales bacterium]|nr:class I SAM-dependent methyltransferase [Rhodospirillales bacterium]
MRCPVCNEQSVAALYAVRWVDRQPAYLKHIAIMQESSRVPARAEPYHFCAGCGLIFRPEEMSSAAATPVAELETPEKFVSSLERHLEERASERFVRRHEWLGARIRPGFHTLDVGCQYGILAKYFAEKGCIATGIDPHAHAIAAGRERFGLNLIVGYYATESFPPRTFDFISAEAVGYYFRPGLKSFVDIVRVHLKDEGIFYIQLASPENIGLHFFPNFIRCLVPTENAASIFDRMSWEVIDINTGDFQRGTFGLLLRKIPQPRGIPPREGGRSARTQLMLSDYNFLPARGLRKPASLVTLMRVLDRLDPTARMPALAAKLANRLYRYAKGADIFE